MVSDIESQLIASEFGFAPVPAAKGTFFLLQVDAVPQSVGFGNTLIVLVLLSVEGGCPRLVRLTHVFVEAIKLDDSRVSRVDLDFVTFGGLGPLCRKDLSFV